MISPDLWIPFVLEKRQDSSAASAVSSGVSSALTLASSVVASVTSSEASSAASAVSSGISSVLASGSAVSSASSAAATAAYSNPNTQYLTQTNSLGVITGIPSIITSQPLTQPAVSTIQPSLTTSLPNSVTSSGTSSHSTTASAASAGATTTPSSQVQNSGLSQGAKAGIAIGAVLAVAAIGLGILFLIRRRRTRRWQSAGTTAYQDNLPEVHTSGESKPAFFGGITKRLGREKLVSTAAPGTTDNAELVGGIAEKRIHRIQETSLPTPAALSSNNRAVTQQSWPHENRLHDSSGRVLPELPESPVGGPAHEVQGSLPSLVELRSDTASPTPANKYNPSISQAISSAGSWTSAVPSSSQGQHHDPTPGSEPPKNEIEILARLKEEAARLEERKKRLHELNKIEDEEENLRKQIAGLEKIT